MLTLALLLRVVGTGLAAGAVAAPGPPGLEAAVGLWEDEACTYLLPLCQREVGEVHAGEGGDYLLRLYRHRPQTIHEGCRMLGDI